MFEIKVTHTSGSVKVLRFKEETRSVVFHKYNQLISEGEILAFELV